jgi:hypothetical protein
MAFDPISAVANVANTILGRILPDKVANDAAKAELAKMQESGELEQTVGQLDINKVEAASSSIFVAGWRPFIGWVCGSAFAYSYVVHPVALTLFAAFKIKLDPNALPALDMSQMTPVLVGMLGLGVMRTIDKAKGTSNGH